MPEPIPLASPYGVSPALEKTAAEFERELVAAIDRAIKARVPKVVIVGFLHLHLTQYSAHVLSEA